MRIQFLEINSNFQLQCKIICLVITTNTGHGLEKQYGWCKSTQMANFLKNDSKNCNKRSTEKLYKNTVHKNEVGYTVTPGTCSRSLTLMHTVVIGNPRIFYKRPRVISLSRGAASLKCISSLCFRLDLIVYDNMVINLIFFAYFSSFNLLCDVFSNCR